MTKVQKQVSYSSSALPYFSLYVVYSTIKVASLFSMGLCGSTFAKPKELTILIIGLDNSGKTTLCGAIKGGVCLA